MSAGTAVWGRVEQQDFRSRVRGTLLGSALGDALGAPVSALALDRLRTAHGADGLLEPAPAYGRRGAVTAATQLTLFSVMSKGWFPPRSACTPADLGKPARQGRGSVSAPPLPALVRRPAHKPRGLAAAR
ncbi:ADP-ribosylglycohydrolase family protein [Streptomyces sp. TRM66268-LWL]|uniref:ADP-ribosylglycohydrolase family protein n=1 Tax=Streptomyces polyasparticus TaxID=2767826 RepID=A0ABR7SU06_9ACTN|nr:ADP-ribosylglycohydrolase family protein [Streptomyces polyasparticus]